MDSNVPKPPAKMARPRTARVPAVPVAPVQAALVEADAAPRPPVKPTNKKAAPVAKPNGPSPVPPALAAPTPPSAPTPLAMPAQGAAEVPAPVSPAIPSPALTLSLPEPVAASAPVAAPSQPAVETIDTPVADTLAEAPAPVVQPAAKEVIMETIENVTAKTQTAFADATERAKGAVEKSQKMFEEANEFGKGNMEALVESSKIAVRGFEAMSQEAAAFAKKSFEEATTVAKTLSSVKSPTEFMKLQSDYMRSAFDAMVQHSSHTTEAMLKLAGEVAQPLSNRASLAAEKMKIAA